MKKPWTMLAKAGGRLEVQLYEEIGRDMWTGEGTTAKQFQEDLKAAGDVSSIHLRVNSPGGSVWDGISMYNILLSHPATVTVTVDGLAASIASVIIMAGSEISMAANSMLMIHNPYTVMGGDAHEMRKMAETLDKVKGSMITAYRRHTKKTKEAVGKIMDDETWLTAEEAVDAGFVEEILDPDETTDLAANLASPILARCRHVPAKLAALAGAKAENRSTSEERDRQRLRLELLQRLP